MGQLGRLNMKTLEGPKSLESRPDLAGLVGFQTERIEKRERAVAKGDTARGI
jgi:hypothetical protein